VHRGVCALWDGWYRTHTTRPDSLFNAHEMQPPHTPWADCWTLVGTHFLAPLPFAAYSLIESELGKPVGEVYSSLSPDPVAAASLGQVGTCANV
jgi:hypothetical protein